MLKSLYFKLDDQNKKHQKIINFFSRSKEIRGNKIDTLSYIIDIYEENLQKPKK